MFGSSSQNMKEPLMPESSSMKPSLGSSQHKLGSMAAALKSKATSAAHAAETALKHGTQAVRNSAQLVESAMKQSVCSAKGKLDGFRKMVLIEQLFASSKEEDSRVAQLVQMGFSRRAAARALEVADNDVAAAASFLCEAVATREKQTRSPHGSRSRSRNFARQSHAHNLAQLASLREDFELQLSIVRSMHAHAMEQLEDLTLAQLLHDTTAVEVESSSELGRPSKTNLLPSVGTWLLPLPLKLQTANPEECVSPAFSGPATESEHCKLDAQAGRPAELATSIDTEVPKETNAKLRCRASRCGA
eukprot:TRINITY_DN102679_c0_g1_i1.p1 TRINITY_DN102679_c0_g1~~TRINITY_DN102679_c0_g1_i1.p1  ORF type:complete len:304 (-),score=65.87 TRINITY_DN102679_c0_g1_i1:236-1147(-)